MKRFISFLLTALIMLLVSRTATAHPGRTDSNGGHTDNSTGEYHYHHGYPAHQHYDMDGDGDLDCPYTFKDNTSNKPQTNTQSNVPNNSEPKSESSSEWESFLQNQYTEKVTPEKEKTISDYVNAVIVFLWDNLFAVIGLMCGGWFFVNLIVEAIKTAKRKKRIRR